MTRTKTGKAKPVFSLRLPQEIINSSKDIPNFRSLLVKEAIRIYDTWKNGGLNG